MEKEKMKWFGRYLGCEISISYRGNNDSAVIFDRENLTLEIWARTEASPNIEARLILKELKNISDEDLTHLVELDNNDDWKGFIIESWEDINNWASIESIDYLRSKHYAVGIPKEFYVTEGEI